MKKFRLVSWEPGYLGVRFLQDIAVHNSFCGLKDGKDITHGIVNGEKPVILIENGKMDLFIEILEKNHVVYEIV